MTRETYPDINWNRDDHSEDLVWTFWFNAQNYAVKRWGHHTDIDWGDLQIIATESLLLLGARFENVYIEGLSGGGAASSTFWHFAKRNIDWAVTSHLARERRHWPLTLIVDGTEIEHPALARSQINAPHDNRRMLNDIVDAIGRLDIADQSLLAMRYFEQMEVNKIGHTLGLSGAGAAFKIRDASFRVLHAARIASEDRPPAALDLPAPRKDITSAARAWCLATIGCDLEEYLAVVSAFYRLDVAYIIRMIERANGIFRRVEDGRNTQPRNNVRNGLELPDETVRRIRERIAEGLTQQKIAAEFGVAQTTISGIKTGKTYAYVA